MLPGASMNMPDCRSAFMDYAGLDYGCGALPINKKSAQTFADALLC
jgi:hypothetical protein